MMRNAWLLTLISLAALLPLQYARAQEITFSGAEIINLAGTIVDTTAETSALPSAYRMTMTNGHPMIVTAPNAFELLCRAIIAWQKTSTFPAEVAIELHDIRGPDYFPEDEPRSPNQMSAVLAADIGGYAEPLLQMTIALDNLIPRSVTFLSKQKLTIAQYIVAMSTLIDEAMKNKSIPRTFPIPLIRSPQQWLSTDRPVVVEAHVKSVPPPIEIDLRIALNNMELTESGPVLQNWKGPIPPFCSVIHIEILGFGPVEDVKLLLDSEMLRSYQGRGPHRHELNTIPLTDGLHTLVATATNPEGQTYTYAFSFTVQNGRRSGFTPAQLAELTAPRQ
jgi:hypothetical protein